MQGVPKTGVGMVPGVHCQPVWHNCPASQISPGMQMTDRCFAGEDDVEGEGVGDGEVGGDVGITTQPVSSNARIHALMCFPPLRPPSNAREAEPRLTTESF